MMKRRIVVTSQSLIFSAFCLCGGLFSSCSGKNDPVTKINIIYDGLIALLRSPSDDVSKTDSQIEEYVKANTNELRSLTDQLKAEMADMTTDEQKNAFLKRCAPFLERVRILQSLLKTTGAFR